MRNSSSPSISEGCGVLIGIASLIVAILAWLSPFNPIGNSPVQQSADASSDQEVIRPTREPVEPTSEAEVLPAEEIEISEPNTSEFEPLDPLPNDFQCPFRAEAGLLNFPSIWYGPFYYNNDSYAIGYDQLFIYVWNSSGGTRQWSDPATVNKRNQWLTLTDTPFEICVDRNGLVFASFSP